MFREVTKTHALQRQEMRCAKCCGDIDSLSEGISWYAIPRIPVRQGREGIDNCVIVCPKCFNAIGQDGTKTIPYDDLICFGVDIKRAKRQP